MKLFCKILAFMFMAVNFVGCHEVSVSNDDIDIPIDANKRYIHFDTEVSTRGTIFKDNYLAADFAVLGYKYLYTNIWDVTKVMATPEVFESTPEVVSYDEGYYTYSNPQPWTDDKYSFFAFYPAENSNIELFDDGISKAGDPYITYSIPLSSDPSSLVDIMTASNIDTDVKQSRQVVMNMHHRLMCVDIGFQNYEEYKLSESQLVPVTIEIQNLNVTLNKLHTTAKIFLDPSIPSVCTGEKDNTFVLVVPSTDQSKAWAFVTYDIKPNTSSDSSMRFLVVKDDEGKDVNNSSFLLIPQTEPLKGSVTLKYKKKYKNGDTWNYIDNPETGSDLFEASLNVNFESSLLEGRRYYIQVTFTSYAVTVDIVSADEWDDLEEDIDYEFE